MRFAGTRTGCSYRTLSEPLDEDDRVADEALLPGYSSTPVLERLSPVPMKESWSTEGCGVLGGLLFFVFRDEDLGSLSTMV